jgi:hypothetical protein
MIEIGGINLSIKFALREIDMAFCWNSNSSTSNEISDDYEYTAAYTISAYFQQMVMTDIRPKWVVMVNC